MQMGHEELILRTKALTREEQEIVCAFLPTDIILSRIAKELERKKEIEKLIISCLKEGGEEIGC